MNQSILIKALVALLVVALVLTVLSVVAAPAQLNLDDGASVGVAAASAVWAKTYGGSGDDRAFSMLQVGDGFLVVGSTKTANATAGWAVMLDSSGVEVWNRTYLYGAETELRCAINTTGGYLLVGNQFTAAGDQNGYAAKIDAQGNVLWQVSLGGLKTDKIFGGAAVADGFYLYGLINLNGSSVAAAWVVKLNANGNVVWDRSYVQGADCALRSDVEAGGGLLVSGYTDSKGDGNYDFLFLKIASDGTLMWNRTYGTAESEKAYSMTPASDGGYVLVGEVESQQTSINAWVVKVDSEGSIQWTRTMGGSGADSPSYVTEARDGGFLVCGFTFSFGGGNRDFWLSKLSSTGSVLFSCTYGDAAFQEAYGVVDAGGDQYVLVGWTDPIGKPDLVGAATYDWLIIKISASTESPSTLNFWLIAAWAAFAVALAAALIWIWNSRKHKIENKLGLPKKAGY